MASYWRCRAVVAVTGQGKDARVGEQRPLAGQDLALQNSSCLARGLAGVSSRQRRQVAKRRWWMACGDMVASRGQACGRATGVDRGGCGVVGRGFARPMTGQEPGAIGSRH